MAKDQIVGIIPARWSSRRLPGKPLANILGKTLIQRTYENAKRSRLLDALVVATDDERIFEHVRSLGGAVVMTSPQCPTGTDRVCEAIQHHFPDATIVVNIQGDEPCLDPMVIDQLIETVQSTPEAVLATPVTKIMDPQDILSSSCVKCVFDKNGRALYFSRAPIPFPQNQKKTHDYYRHLGIYCFRKEFLFKYHVLEMSRIQEIEDLEQLKVLENGYPIHVCIVGDQGVNVDTPEDLKRLETYLCQAKC